MSDIELAIVVDGPAVAKASATAESVTPDPAAGNNFATAEYEVDPGEHVFLDGFEPESVQL